MLIILALRNIFRSKKNSFVILLLIAVITFLFFLGNTIIAQSSRGLHAAYTESLTGDIVLEKAGDVTMSLFGANAPHLEDFFVIEPLPAYNKIVEIVNAQEGIECWTSQVSTAAKLKAMGGSGTVLVTGVDAAEYFNVFTGIEVERGRFLNADEQGIMIHRELAAELEAAAGEPLLPGTPVMLTTSGRSGFKIREVPLAGVYHYKTENSALYNIVLTDAQTARALAAIRIASADVQVSEQTRKILDDFESLFDAPADYVYVPSNSTPPDFFDEHFFDDDNAPTRDIDVSSAGGDWNFMLIKTVHGVNANKIIAALNEALKDYGVAAVGWRTAAGISALLVLVLQAVYNAGIIIVCIAAGIASVNILLIAVFKRTREIGTLRAIGASSSYIRLLLISENAALGFAGGITGVALGAAAFKLINALSLTIGNRLIVNLLGVETLHITFYPEYALLSLGFALALTMLSLIVPIEMAVRIEPVVAVREG